MDDEGHLKKWVHSAHYMVTLSAFKLRVLGRQVLVQGLPSKQRLARTSLSDM